MEDNTNTPLDQHIDDAAQKEIRKTAEEEDGRNKEWQDRARVNLEVTKKGTKTTIERDFEPEQESSDQADHKTDQSIY